ncbi:hypothetical protein F8388_005166 [Cannabis sativa]|uniref:Uncharacterized protein n=1 Tax=Cannabis sativa TaxID=3483 RepID=A0A7J6ELB2_CANSA|nr:hypothetical protein F8388_005166 [Cannabis sativa]
MTLPSLIQIVVSEKYSFTNIVAIELPRQIKRTRVEVWKVNLHTLTACSADLREWSTCSTLLFSLYNLRGKVATSPTAYTSGTLDLKKASIKVMIKK